MEMFGGGSCWDSNAEREVEIEPNVNRECLPKFCYLGYKLGAGGVD